jgi:hypothetical protein
MCGATQSKTMLSLGVENPGTVRFAITPVGFPLALDTSQAYAISNAILLPGITPLADVHLGTTTGTQKESSTGWHRRKVPTSALNEPEGRAILVRLCESTDICQA